MRSVPRSGSSPEAIRGLSSKSGCVTGFEGDASWSSPLVLSPPQAARNALRLD
jgi:hypothetical protein